MAHRLRSRQRCFPLPMIDSVANRTGKDGMLTSTCASAVVEYGQRGMYMSAPLLELEGTCEEIVARIAGLSGQKLHVLIYAAEERERSRDTRPIGEVLAEIAASIPAAELSKLPSDFTDQLDHYIYGSPKK